MASRDTRMRLWSLHPKYLDAQGLVALWRESLLAQAVLHGKTKGYQNHPQLLRFRNESGTLSAISLYLKAVYDEAELRGYSFDKGKIVPAEQTVTLYVTSGQLEYEWSHLMRKLSVRSPALYQQFRSVIMPDPHPLFRVQAGDIASWERMQG